jgi:outer membrane protein assembly factor BamE (lipoprotein component of BamABCDE complex)
MKAGIQLRSMGWLIAAGLAFGAAAAQAAPGVSITQRQEARVAVGMTAAEVQQSLGRPADVVKYPYASGPTWIYEVAEATFGATEFDVQFGSDGKVTSAAETILGDSD